MKMTKMKKVLAVALGLSLISSVTVSAIGEGLPSTDTSFVQKMEDRFQNQIKTISHPSGGGWQRVPIQMKP